MRKIEYVVSDERLITPSGLSLVGQVLGKSNLIKKNRRFNGGFEKFFGSFLLWTSGKVGKKGIEVINLFEMSANSVKSPDKRLTAAANSSMMDISNHLEVSTMPRKLKPHLLPRSRQRL